MANPEKIPAPAVTEQPSKSTGILAWISICIARLFVVFGGIFAYIPQYVKIDMTDNPNGFSIYVSLALVFASCIKFSYWFKHGYDIALFGQTIVNILTMLAMLDLRVRILNRVRVIPDPERRAFFDWDFSYFWDWTDLVSYVQAIVMFTFSSAFIMMVFGNWPFVMPAMGLLAAAAETVMTVPQLVTNYEKKSTEGLSKNMVAIWIASDIFKVAYLMMSVVPITFLIATCCQLCVDITIGCQIIYYGDGEDHEHGS